MDLKKYMDLFVFSYQKLNFYFFFLCFTHICFYPEESHTWNSFSTQKCFCLTQNIFKRNVKLRHNCFFSPENYFSILIHTWKGNYFLLIFFSFSWKIEHKTSQNIFHSESHIREKKTSHSVSQNLLKKNVYTNTVWIDRFFLLQNNNNNNNKKLMQENN